MKLEMKDNVDENEAEGIFMSNKLYALRGPNSKKEKIVARGVMKWMSKDDDVSAKRRK